MVYILSLVLIVPCLFGSDDIGDINLVAERAISEINKRSIEMVLVVGMHPKVDRMVVPVAESVMIANRLTARVKGFEAYDLQKIYGVTPSTGGPYSIPPPRGTVDIGKISERHWYRLEVIEKGYVRISGDDMKLSIMVNDEELLRILESIVPR